MFPPMMKFVIRNRKSLLYFHSIFIVHVFKVTTHIEGLYIDNMEVK